MPLIHSHHVMGEPISGELAAKLGLQPSPRENEVDLNFLDLPPFPDDVPTAPLLRINLAKLESGDEVEIERLFRACCDLGFFYLDLRDGGEELLETAEEMFVLGEKVFDLGVEEKEGFDFMGKGSYFGYKGYRDVDGQRNEFWNVSKDDILGLSERLPNSSVLSSESSRTLIKRYMLQGHTIVTLLLRILNDKVAFPPKTLQNLHRLHALSGDQVRWVKSPPQPPQNMLSALGAHTDFGSLTLLFNRLGGLQVLSPNTNTWSYVKPLGGHCVVNLGDAMVKFTAGVLRSNFHRVVNPPGEQGGETRYSLVYFARPEDEVLLRRLEGSRVVDERSAGEEEEEEVVTAKEWILRRAGERRGVVVRNGEVVSATGSETKE